jgi:hypothetical protein
MNGAQTKRTERRSVLLTAAALGAFVCLFSGTVLFSALTDTARTGTNSAESAALAASADVQLATATRAGDTISCGMFVENLSTPLFTVVGVGPGFQTVTEYACIKSIGSQEVTVSAAADELTDTDYACTGDEDLHGDTTCGGDQAGELSSVLFASYSVVNCQTAAHITGASLLLKDSPASPVNLGTLAPGGTACLSMSLIYGSSRPVTEQQAAQSDRSTWRAKFTAQA